MLRPLDQGCCLRNDRRENINAHHLHGGHEYIYPYIRWLNASKKGRITLQTLQFI
jgi:hypothetical protein